MSKRWVLALAAAGLLAGCDRHDQSAVKPAPATQPTRVAAAVPVDASILADPEEGEADTTAAAPHVTLAAPAQTAGSTFLLHDAAGDHVHAFPRPRLRLTREGDRMTAILYSEDPKTAISRDYNGNSFYLVMPLNIEDPQKLNGADWRYKAPTAEERDTLEGVFLDGQRLHLQPYDVSANFMSDGKTAQVNVAGQFLKFDSAAASGLGTPVGVQGEFQVSVEHAK